MDRSRVGRGLVILAAAALAVAVVSPAFSAAPLTKAKVRKIAKKQALEVLAQLEPTLSVGSASSINGNGVFEVDYNANPIAGTTAIFSGSGLTLEAACASSNEISLTASTSKADSSIYVTASGLDGAITVDGNDRESGAFDPGIPFDLLLGNDGDPMLITLEYDSNDGSSVSGIIATDENNAGGGCQAHGHVIAS